MACPHLQFLETVASAVPVALVRLAVLVYSQLELKVRVPAQPPSLQQVARVLALADREEHVEAYTQLRLQQSGLGSAVACWH